jgi:hypothetical protein
MEWQQGMVLSLEYGILSSGRIATVDEDVLQAAGILLVISCIF